MTESSKFDQLRDHFLTHELEADGTVRTVAHDPPVELAAVCAWAQRYNTERTKKPLSMAVSDLDQRMALLAGKTRPVQFSLYVFRCKGDGTRTGKATSLRQAVGGPLEAHSWRGSPFTGTVFEGEVTVDQAKSMIRWALVSDRTCLEYPTP